MDVVVSIFSAMGIVILGFVLTIICAVLSFAKITTSIMTRINVRFERRIKV